MLLHGQTRSSAVFIVNGPKKFAILRKFLMFAFCHITLLHLIQGKKQLKCTYNFTVHFLKIISIVGKISSTFVKRTTVAADNLFVKHKKISITVLQLKVFYFAFCRTSTI